MRCALGITGLAVAIFLGAWSIEPRPQNASTTAAQAKSPTKPRTEFESSAEPETQFTALRDAKPIGHSLVLSAAPVRVKKNLVALYEFRTTIGPVVRDTSGNGTPLDLRIADLKDVRRYPGALVVAKDTIIRTQRPAKKIIDAVRKTGELSIEIWFQPENTRQDGPARIVTLSKNSTLRNFTIGQEADRFDARLRTTKTSTNGMPSIQTPRRTASDKLTHVVYTRDKSGRAALFVNAKQRGRRTVAGSLARWDNSFRLAFANELSGDRPWKGALFLVAIYNRDLSAKEIEQNFAANTNVRAALARTKAPPRPSREELAAARHFKQKIAPLLAKHCLECHGWKSRKGKLDLARKSLAFKGGAGGRAIIPGDAENSSLWEQIDTDAMPKDRAPLSAADKKLIKEWIDRGAVWSMEHISPVAFDVGKSGGANFLRRLTIPEYINTVRATVGVEIAQEARKWLPKDLRADGFNNTSYNLTVDLGHVEAYAKLAEIVVAKMDVEKFAAAYSSSREFTDANIKRIAKGMGKLLLRGPVSEKELADYLRIAAAVRKERGDFKEAISFLLEAMLQSPRFLYRMEIQRGSGERKPVGSFELAARLSYILWGAPPDQELLRAAESGALSDPRKTRAQVQRMLKDPRTQTRSLEFASQWLNLERLSYLRPNPGVFPKWNPVLAGDMRRETLDFYNEVIWKRKRPMSELLNAQVTFLTPGLAKHYGLPAPKQRRVDLATEPSRGGLLTHGSLLTIGGDEASMVSRGLFVLHDLLNGKVDDPPPCVDTTPVPTKPGKSQRGIAEARIANKACGGCHGRFETLAFGLERFDGLGTFHKVDEHGNKLREDGEILFPGSKTPVAYKTAQELMNLLAKSDVVKMTLTRKVTQFALGRPLTKADEAELKKIHQAAQDAGGTYSATITAIVMSDLVRRTRTEK